jgi:hypothetical protein
MCPHVCGCLCLCVCASVCLFACLCLCAWCVCVLGRLHLGGYTLGEGVVGPIGCCFGLCLCVCRCVSLCLCVCLCGFGFVALIIAAIPNLANNMDPTAFPVSSTMDVVFLEFRRTPNCYKQLMEDASLIPCRHVFPGGGIILCLPENIDVISNYIASVGFPAKHNIVDFTDLRCRHVTVERHLEAHLMDLFDHMIGSGVDGGKGRDKCKLKSRTEATIPPVTDSCSQTLAAMTRGNFQWEVWGDHGFV